MSELPKCLLCGCVPIVNVVGMAIHPVGDANCPQWGVNMTPEQWAALMGRGEPVAFAKNGNLFWHGNPTEKRGVDCQLYTQAPAVSIDPARFRQIGFTRIDHIGKPSSTIVSDTKYRAASDAGVYVPVFVDEGESQAPAVDCAVVLDALESARLFIVNGVDLGFIKMPDADTPDPAHETLPKIELALKAIKGEG